MKSFFSVEVGQDGGETYKAEIEKTENEKAMKRMLMAKRAKVRHQW